MYSTYTHCICPCVCVYALFFSHLEPLVLQHLLDGDQLSRVTQLGLVDHPEGAIPNHLGVSVADLLGPVRTLARGRHHRGHLAAIFISWEGDREREEVSLKGSL